MTTTLSRRAVLVRGALALSATAFATGALAQAEIPVGWVLPLSGGSAAIGQQARTGVQIAVDQINAAGGIKAMGGAKLKLVFADSQSKPDIGSSETERLIQRENVAVIGGAFNSAVTFPATELAERYKTPWIVMGAVKDEITERNFKYVFRINNKATYDAREQLDAIDLLKQETGQGPKTLAIFYEGSDWGRSHAANVRKLAKERGYTLVLDEAAPPNQVDFSAQLLKIRAARPDALIAAFYTPDHLLLSRQLLEQQLNLPFGLHSVGGGTEDPSFYKAVSPKAVAYYFVQEDRQVDALQGEPLPEFVDVEKRFRDTLGYGMSAYGAQGFSVMYVIRDALERARSADRQALRDAIAATDLTSGPAMYVGYQRIKFDEQGQNTFAHGAISQNLNGQRRTVWPAASRAPDTKPAWPVPAFGARS
ncbi:ABC transporter substrate-binding protein [uncultured Methylobacterium sp.]|jgi:branched-chain amino acid transport system substrate-binding protein|uniref:ABC transporter substrate-binding protein n=1 Tax=uncultured Methylobacterium sp. TaxID=157278 RepID=UPI00263108A1|nr:ABC transporter substrate-binding protein [uncultured Methylobacterium sp.]